MLDALVLNQQEKDMPLTQLPEYQYEQQCLIEETCTQQRRIVALAYASRPVPECLLIVGDKRPISPIFDYHQILLLAREKRHQDNDLLIDAQAYIGKTASIKMRPAFQNLKNFLEFLSNDKDDSSSQSNKHQRAKTFIKRNLHFCRSYSEFLAKNKKKNALFSATLSQVSADKQRAQISHTKK